MLTRTRTAQIAALFLLLASVFLGGSESFGAIPHAYAQLGSSPLQSTLSTIGTAQSMLLSILNFLSLFAIRILEKLLEPDVIFQFGNGTSGIATILNNLWVLSRDITNLLLAIVLIVMAVVTVVKGSTENLKNVAPKLVIALIAVNFSWFIPRVILDFAQVLTYTVYQLPRVANVNGCMVDGQECQVIDQVLFFEEIKKYGETYSFEITDGSSDSAGTWHCKFGDTVCYRTIKYSQASTNNAAYNVLNGLVVNYGRLKDFSTPPNVDTSYYTMSDADKVSTVIAYILKVGIMLAFHIALLLPILALLFAFLVRIPILWITIAFMPFVVLAYALEGSPFSQLGSATKKLQDEFLSIAFLPLLTAIPLTVGFIMVQYCSNLTPPEADKLPTFTSIINLNSLWDAIWMLMALGVTWVGVFAALKRNSIVAMVSEPIRSFGQSVGKFMAEVPLGLPLLPMPGGRPGQRFAPLAALRKTQNAMGAFHATGDINAMFNPGATAGSRAVLDALRNNARMETNIKTNLAIQVKNATSREQFERHMGQIRAELASKGVTGVSDRDILDGIERKMPEFQGQLVSALDRWSAAHPAATPPAAGAAGGGPAPGPGAAPAAATP